MREERVTMPPRTLTRAERWCIVGFVALLVVAVIAPRIEQPEAYHAFADARAWAGVPNAANVLSNVAFVIAAAMVGALVFRPPDSLGAAVRAGLAVTAIGLLVTAGGSTYYHWRPENSTLVWDRAPITITFAGVLMLLLAQRVSERLARAALPILLVLGLASVFYWQASGNVTPYVVFQVGAMIALVVILLLARRRDDPFAWWWLIVAYTVAKVAELSDAAVFEATRGVVSGHTLKHLVSALAAAGFVWPLLRSKR